MCRAVMELRKLHGLEKMSGGSITLFNFSERAKILTIFSIQTFFLKEEGRSVTYTAKGFRSGGKNFKERRF